MSSIRRQNFCKLHADGAAFIIWDEIFGPEMKQNVSPNSDEVALWCHPVKGISAQGLLLVSVSTQVDLEISAYDRWGQQMPYDVNALKCLCEWLIGKKYPLRQLVIRWNGVINAAVDMQGPYPRVPFLERGKVIANLQLDGLPLETHLQKKIFGMHLIELEQRHVLVEVAEWHLDMGRMAELIATHHFLMPQGAVVSFLKVDVTTNEAHLRTFEPQCLKPNFQASAVLNAAAWALLEIKHLSAPFLIHTEFGTNVIRAVKQKGRDTELQVEGAAKLVARGNLE